MKKNIKEVHLPPISMKHQTTGLSTQSSQTNASFRQSLQDYLQEVKIQQLGFQKKQHSKKQERIKHMQMSQRTYQQASKLQIRKLQGKQRVIVGEEEEKQLPQPILTIRKLETDWKPPHRYKTTIAYIDDQLLVYGGLGCEKYLGWAKLNLKQLKWTSSSTAQNRQVSIYGHSMAIYKGIALIYGGSCMESITHDLIKIDLKSMALSHLNPAPFRRKEHAMTMLSRYMLVHGGIQNGIQVKNTLFYFDVQTGRWSIPQQFQLPFLAYHTIAALPFKTRKKNTYFQDIINDAVFIYGGKDERGQVSNRFLKFKTRESGQVTTQQLPMIGGPQPRFMHSMQFLQPCYICIYGGRSEQQYTETNKMQGIFNDIFLYNVQRSIWIVPTMSQSLDYRFGASSCVNRNRMLIFGGSSVNQYANGCVLELVVHHEGDEEENQEESQFRKTRLRG